VRGSVRGEIDNTDVRLGSTAGAVSSLDFSAR